MSFQRREPRANPTEGFRFAKPTRAPKDKPEKQRKAMRRNQARRVVRESVFKPYQDWLHADGAVCVVCGESITERIQGAHVGQGGTGKTHGSIADTIRLCADSSRGPGCHTQHDRNGTLPGFFHLWSRARFRAWDVEQRLVHWEAFRAWAGIEIERLRPADEPGTAVELARIVACDEAIANCVAELRGGTISDCTTEREA